MPFFSKVSPDEILLPESERPQVFENAIDYPFEKLTDRAFEKLTYSVFREELNGGEYQGRFDQVELMQGTGESGRDVRLLHGGLTVGVVQCKHSMHTHTKLDRPTVAKELVKIILHAIVDPAFLSQEGQIAWYIVTNTDLNAPALDFAANARGFLLENRDQLREWTRAVLANYAAFSSLTYNDSLEGSLIRILGRIVSERRAGAQMSLAVERYKEKIAPQFFRVKLVVDSDFVLEKVRELTSTLLARLPSPPPVNEQKIEVLLQVYAQQARDSASRVRTLLSRSQDIHLERLYEPLVLRDREMNEKHIVATFPKEIFQRSSQVRISNLAGMGKSTLVAWLTRRAIDEAFAIPVVITLRKLGKHHRLQQEILARILPLGSTQGPQVLQSICEGGFLFLLDGYDEVPVAEREAVVNDIREFVTKASANKFVLTSRPDSDLANFSDFWPFELIDLDRNQAVSLLRRIGQVADSQAAEGLIEEIRKNPSTNLDEFLGNPLLVSLLYLTYTHTPKIPLRRTLFFRRIYDALFEGHDLLKERYLRPKRSALDIDRFEIILRNVAWQGASRMAVEHQRRDLLSMIASSAEYAGIALNTPRDLLHDLTQAVPLMVEEADLYRWSHRSLQDYFAALFLQAAPPERREAALRRIYEHEALESFSEMLRMIHELDPFIIRHSMFEWVLRDYISWCFLPSGGFSQRRRITFELQEFGICFHTEAFLEAQVPTSHLAAVNAQISGVPIASHILGNGWGPAKLPDGTHLTIRHKGFSRKVSAILHGLLNILSTSELHPAPREHETIKGIGPLRPNVWYLSTNQIVNEKGQVEDYVPSDEEASYIDRVVIANVRLAVLDKVRKTLSDIDKEKYSRAARGKELFDLI